MSSLEDALSHWARETPDRIALIHTRARVNIHTRVHPVNESDPIRRVNIYTGARMPGAPALGLTWVFSVVATVLALLLIPAGCTARSLIPAGCTALSLIPAGLFLIPPGCTAVGVIPEETVVAVLALFMILVGCTVVGVLPGGDCIPPREETALMVVIVAAALAFVLLLRVAGERTVADAVAWARFEEVHWSHIKI